MFFVGKFSKLRLRSMIDKTAVPTYIEQLDNVYRQVIEIAEKMVFSDCGRNATVTFKSNISVTL